MNTITQWATRIAGAAMLGATAWIHADLYSSDGYKEIPRVGHLFLLLIIVASVIAFAVLVAPKKLVGFVALIGAGTEFLTAAALVILTHRTLPGLKGFTESSSAPHFDSALTVEIIGVVVLGVLTLTSFRRQSPSQ